MFNAWLAVAWLRGCGVAELAGWRADAGSGRHSAFGLLQPVENDPAVGEPPAARAGTAGFAAIWRRL